MFDMIKKSALVATVGTLAFSSAAIAIETPPVSEVTVEVSAEAAQDDNAARVYDTITVDLAKAISERVTRGTGGDAYNIKVDIRKLALDGDTLQPDDTEFNQLEGVVVFNGPRSGAGNATLPIRISAVTGDQTAPEGVIMIKPGTDDFYDAMIAGFADNVAEELTGVYTGG
ncbi:hypothetical protein [Sulfitobacter sp. JB4-11]|uniref:hypothetical protein n=1 Tax=Sulfitobacter rhodophyticola TaxID=3238304 RepID=UPI0035179F24